MLNSDTPIAWLLQRFSQHAPLMALLGATSSQPRVCQPGQASREWDRFLVIKPPLSADAFIYGGRWPQTAQGRYLAWAELRTDKLPTGQGSSQGASSAGEVLSAIVDAMAEALLSETAEASPDAPGGGLVHGAQIVGFYLPPAAALSEIARVAQKGLVLDITFS